MENNGEGRPQEKRIVIADDEPVNRMLYRAYIESFLPAYKDRIDEVNNGAALDSLLEKGFTDIALVLTDNNMSPGPKGIELIAKYSGRLSETRFVLVSGDYGLSEKEIKDMGAYAFLEKPFTSEELEEAVRGL